MRQTRRLAAMPSAKYSCSGSPLTFWNGSDLGSTAHRIHRARKFCQQSVAGVLHNPAVVLLDLRIDQIPEMCFMALVRAFLVGAHQPAVTGHIGGENGGQPAFNACHGQSGAPGTAWAE